MIFLIIYNLIIVIKISIFNFKKHFSAEFPSQWKMATTWRKKIVKKRILPNKVKTSGEYKRNNVYKFEILTLYFKDFNTFIVGKSFQ